MTTISPFRSSGTAAPVEALAAAGDRHLMAGHEAILKGVFEHDRDVALIVGPRCEPFDRLFLHADLESTQRLLRQHGTSVKAIGDAGRAVTLAHQRARSGSNAIALVPNAMLHLVIPRISNIAAADLPAGTAMVVLLEDDSLPDAPDGGGPCPMQIVTSLGMPTIVPASINDLKDDVDCALRLSRSSARPVALVVHRLHFHQGEMVDVRPNRAAPIAEVLLSRGRRKPRWSEVRDVTRMARRMELNHVRSQPNPGEIAPVGFLTVGPTDLTVQFLLGVLHLVGRVPLFHLGMVYPLDEVAISRFLSRCEQVIVLEPRPGRPGVIEQSVLRVAECMHGKGERCASVWGKRLPEARDTAATSEANATAEAHQMPSAGITARDVLHPSLLIRRVLHLIHGIRPQLHVSSRLEADPPALEGTVPARGRHVGFAAAARHIRRTLKEVDQWLRKQSESAAEAPSQRRALAIDGVTPSGQFDHLVSVETWGATSFVAAGVSAIRQAARERQPWIFIVADFTTSDRTNLERLARGGVPDEVVDITHIERVRLDEPRAFREKLQSAVLHDGLTILLLQDGWPPQFDVEAIEKQLSEIDRTGVEPLLRIIRSTDEVCRFPVPRNEDESDEDDADLLAGPPQHELKTEITVEHNARKFGSRVRLSLRPLKEQIDIIRTRPPAWIWQRYARGPLALPTPIHRHAHQWRLHLAGVRGGSPGMVTMLLADAGRAMGYNVVWTHRPTRISPGLRGWSQVLFTRAGDKNPAPRLSPVIPFGEADVLIGLDAFETLRAVDPARNLRVASGHQTYAIANAAALSHEPFHAADRDPERLRSRLIDALHPVTQHEHRRIDDVASVCRQWFYTDRVTDIAMLGMAFQLGMIPVSVEAMDAAIGAAESRGLGRVREAFTFGRHLGADDRMLRRSVDASDDDLHRVIRRTIKSLRGRRLLSRTLADRFKRLSEQSLTSMPGLSETATGRRAMRDYVIGLYRCVEWGGMDYADRYATLIMNLYQSDHADSGRAITRDAILPLAEAMLIRDPIYLASMATSLTERARFRQLHNIKAARGDEVERRYLTRIDLIGFGYRVRADLRSSDWPARLARAARYVLPTRWRGTRLDRERRDYIISLVQRATYHHHDQYETWCNAMHRLHTQSRDDRLRDMAMAEVRMLAEPARDGEG